ncbi:MAG: AAC(3) family N-acetyltransferase [Holdemania massiliensis]
MSFIIPTRAYVAWGKYAKLLCNHQSLHFPLSEESPAARLYELKGSVLLMGVDYQRCTALHLAEYRSEIRPVILRGAAVELEGKRMWKKYLDLDIDSEIFNKVGKRLEEKGFVKKGKVGMADLSCLKRMRRSMRPSAILSKIILCPVICSQAFLTSKDVVLRRVR